MASLEVLKGNEIHYEIILGKYGAKDKVWVAKESFEPLVEDMGFYLDQSSNDAADLHAIIHNLKCIYDQLKELEEQ